MSLNRGASLTAHSYDPWAARHLPGKPERERERERGFVLVFCVLCFCIFFILLLSECPIWVVSKPSTLFEKNEKMKKEMIK